MSDVRPTGRRVPEDVARAIRKSRPVPDGPLLCVEELFAGRREVRLLFGNEEYRLRITRNEKLILTK